MTTSKIPLPPDPQLKRLAAEERTCLVRFTFVWLASLALLGIAWLTSPSPPPAGAEPREIPAEAGHLVASITALP
jgi:hypothetical protein